MMKRANLVFGNNHRHGPKRIIATALSAILLTVCLAADQAWAVAITLTSVEGFPNGRTTDDLPANAIDGNLSTFTWTTNAFNVDSPSHLGVGFVSTSVNRIRLWKDDSGGGGPNIKNLTIQYTTDTVGTLSSRIWLTVAGLTNGFFGTELLDATSVNSNGTVVGDIHDSVAGDGFASLVFDTIVASGLRISFANPSGTNVNHYRVGEFEAHYESQLVPEPSTLLLVGSGLASLGFLRRRKRAV